MKYEVHIVEGGFGLCSIPEHHFGEKTICHEIFDDRQAAMSKAAEVVKDLYNKYEICREWEIVSDNEIKWIKTNTEDIDGWSHYYEAMVYEWTDEEFEEMKKEGIA